MNIMVIGRGHVGSYLARYFNVKDRLHWQGDLAHIGDLELKTLNPDFIINAAGKTDLSWCEENKDECIRCNVELPTILAKRIARLYLNNVPLIHLSTGCAWEGPYKEDGKPFRPNDQEKPTCFYTMSKVLCDKQIMNVKYLSWLILRPRLVYSDAISNRNTLYKINCYPKLTNIPNSISSVSIIAKTIEKVIDYNTESCYNRIMNVYDQGVITPFNIGRILQEQGCRLSEPSLLEKNDLDSWHKPKRVDVVMSDPFFENLVNPDNVVDEITKQAKLLRINLDKNRDKTN